MKKEQIIEIQEGHEYHVLVDDPKNIYNEDKFFYPVYKKSASLVKEICRNNSDSERRSGKDYQNNIIMYCAERGGGKSTAMQSFAGALERFSEDRKEYRDGFEKMWGKDIEDFSFTVLNVIDPTEIHEHDMFMRIILSKMFTRLRSKWEEDGKCKYGDTFNNEDMRCLKLHQSKIINAFMECYRFIDVIYQDGGGFECDDDLDELTDLGDSGQLKEKFRGLTKLYLEEITGKEAKKAKDCFLVLQIDDADLNSAMAFKIIEDIRKYCIVTNVIILMSVNIAQMHQVLEQHFVNDFKSLLDAVAKYDKGNEVKAIRLKDCQKMAMRYIDKVMPAAHQIHLPKVDDFIGSSDYTLTVKYLVRMGGYGSKNDECRAEYENLLDFRDKSDKPITDYQELLLRLIYNKTGLVLIKPEGYPHNFLPKTMRGLCHFLAYMRTLPNLDISLGYAEINEILNAGGEAAIGKSKDAAENELRKRIDNLDAIKQYFLKNWCTVRLSKNYQDVIENLEDADPESRVQAASKQIDRLFYPYKADMNGNTAAPPLSPLSYSYLYEELHQLNLEANNTEKATDIYRFVYALRFYFLLKFHGMILSGIRKGGDFTDITKHTNIEVWEPLEVLEPLNDRFNSVSFTRFEVNSRILKGYIENTASEIINQLVRENCFVMVEEKNYFTDDNEQPINKDKKIICDIGASMLRNICFEKLGGENNRFINSSIALLSNWEVQRYVEKRRNNNREISVTDYIYAQFINIIFNCLDDITYLPIDWYKSTDMYPLNANIVYLMLANEKLALEIAELLFVSLLNKSTNLPDGIDSTYEDVDIVGNSLFSNSAEIKREKTILMFLGIISKTAKKVYNAYNDLQKKYQLLKEPVRKKVNDIEKIRGSIDNWKKIMDDKTIKSIEQEINTAFSRA